MRHPCSTKKNSTPTIQLYKLTLMRKQHMKKKIRIFKQIRLDSLLSSKSMSVMLQILEVPV